VSDHDAQRGGPPAKGDAARLRRRGRRRTGRHRASPPDILYHATSVPRAECARDKGTLEVRGGRPVYLSRHEGQAWHVAHRQGEDPAVLFIDVSRARRDGCRFERNNHGLWQVRSVPARHVLNLREGFAEQVSAGGIPVWFGPDGPEVLLIRVQRRSGTTWEVAKGKLEAGESPGGAAIREVQEEMGREMELELVQNLGFVRYGFQTPDGSPRLKTLHMYLMRAQTRYRDFSPSIREGIKDVAWFTPEAAQRAVTHRSLRPLMRHVRRLLEDTEPFALSAR
jgi:8-oxo-dGTP pyrophosphatase MutT (NUDIX family)